MTKPPGYGLYHSDEKSTVMLDHRANTGEKRLAKEENESPGSYRTSKRRVNPASWHPTWYEGSYD